MFGLGRADPITEHRHGSRRPAGRRSRLPAHSYGLSLAQSVRPSPARAEPHDHDTWLPVPDVSDLPELEDLVDPQGLVAPRASRPEGNVRPTPVRPRPSARSSPARARPHDPDAWFPVPDVDLLPELEELLAPDKLVPEPEPSSPSGAPASPAPPVEPEPAVARRAPEPEARERPLPARPATRRKHRRRSIEPLARTRPTPVPAIEVEPLPRTARRVERTRSRRRYGWRALLLACALVVATTVAGLAVPRLLQGAPGVELRVDGKRLSVTTDANTVGALLGRRGIRLSEHDRVVPGLGAEIEDGLEVHVKRAFTVEVDRDGALSRMDTTHTDPSELLEKLGLDPNEYVLVDPPARLGPGKTLKVRSIRDATINVDGISQVQRTPAMSVAEFLEQNGVVLGAFDSVTPSPETAITDGAVVTVARISGEVDVKEEPIPFTTEKRDDPNLPVGQQKVVQEGSDGLARVSYEVTLRDGQEVERKPISNVPIRPAVPKIIAVGTQRSTPSPVAAAGGNSRTGSASWYQSPFGDDSCATKEYVPKGTMLKVTNLETGQSVYCRVADRVEAARVVDMDREAFAQLKSPHLGVFAARIDW